MYNKVLPIKYKNLTKLCYLRSYIMCSMINNQETHSKFKPFFQSSKSKHFRFIFKNKWQSKTYPLMLIWFMPHFLQYIGLIPDFFKDYNLTILIHKNLIWQFFIWLSLKVGKIFCKVTYSFLAWPKIYDVYTSYKSYVLLFHLTNVLLNVKSYLGGWWPIPKL